VPQFLCVERIGERLRRGVEDRDEVGARAFAIDRQTQRAELEREVGANAGRCDAFDEGAIAVAHARRRAVFAHVFAEHVDRRVDPVRVEPSNGGDRFVGVFARDEALRDREEQVLGRGHSLRRRQPG
jgi:hypothetical protein